MIRNSALVVLLVALVLLLWAFYFEPSSFRIREERIAIPRWPQVCNDMRIAVLADLHVGSPYQSLASLQKLVTEVNLSRPDLILLPGDFVIQGVFGGTFVPPEDTAAVLADLQAPMGLYAVLGNHDWWLDAERVEKALTDQGITVLEDMSVLIDANGCQLRLVGISDFREGPHNIQRAMSGTDESDPILAFTHDPDIFPLTPRNIALTVAGHTHGGQVYLPGIGRPVVPSEYGERYAFGHIVEEGKHLYVSAGVGTSIIPVRFLVPPEVTILKVRRAERVTF